MKRFLYFIYIFIYFGLLLNLVISSQNIPNQFKASCFPGCRCNATIIECCDLGETTTELFRHIQPNIYPDLDTLIVTGNNFSILPNENIFGANIRHKKLSLVNISNNGIQSFGAQTFIGMPRVEYLYLDDNTLNDVVDDQPFNYFTSLKFLSMNSIFGNDVSANRRAEIIYHIFHNNHSFVDLNEIILTNNRINHLRENTFCNTKSLTQLRLSNNQLKIFNFKSDCISNIRLLDLAGNQLQTVSSSIWDNMPLLDTADFSRNPLYCDCDLDLFHKFAIEETNAFLNQEATVCANPASMAGKKFFDIDDDISLCTYDNSKSGIKLSKWFLLLLIGISILLAYQFGRKRINFVKNFDLKRSTSQLRVPLVSEGYSQLKTTDEIPSPAFV